jgi:beta-galactosidase beta subunit
MSNEQTVVITVYGHDKAVDKIAVNLFNRAEEGSHESDARKYCYNTNSLELEGDAWVFAKIVSPNTPYAVDEFLPMRFDIVLKLDDRSIQKVFREVDSQNLAKALKGANEAIQDKIFRNMSQRATTMLKEDMEYMGPIHKTEVLENQEKILDITRRLEETGEIVIPYEKGDWV